MSREAVEKTLRQHVEFYKRQGQEPKTEKLRDRIVKIARESDIRTGKNTPGKEK